MATKSQPTSVIATYGFNVPCRRFLLTTNVTRDRRLPVADEFVLRLLKVTGRLEARRLGAYFGFSPSEASILLLDLANRGLVALLGEEVELTASAQEKFRTAGADFPRIVDLETWVVRLWFDLISQNMMAPERQRPLDHLIDLKPASDTKTMPVDFARTALEQNFQEFLRKVRKINNPDDISLYSVSDAAADRFGMVVSSGAMELELDPEPRLVPRLLKVEVEDVARFRPLHDAMHDAVRRLTHPDPSNAGLTELRRLTGDSTVQTHHDSHGRLQLTTWLGAPDNAQDRRRVFGASYVTRNSDAFLQIFQRHSLPRLKAGQPRHFQLFWFRPVGTSWGASTDLQRTIGEIVGRIKQDVSAKAEVRTTVVSPAIARNETRNRFRRLFDRGLCSPAGFLSSGTEVLYLRGVAAMVLTQVALSSSTSIPVGFVLTGEADLKRLEQGLKLSTIASDHEVIWNREATASDSQGLVLEAV